MRSNIIFILFFLNASTLATDKLQKKSHVDKLFSETSPEKLLKEPKLPNTTKSVWLIRDCEKDPAMFKAMTIHKEQNFAWRLGEEGLKQAARMANVLKEHYANTEQKPLIFASPFKRTIETGYHLARVLNTKVKIEEGLMQKRHGFWKHTDEIYSHFRTKRAFLDDKYKSKFRPSEIMRRFMNLKHPEVAAEVLKRELDFDQIVANYFLNMFHEETNQQDIIIVGARAELYNIQKIITGEKLYHHDKKEFEKLGAASMFQYTLNSKSSKLELKARYFKGLKLPLV